MANGMSTSRDPHLQRMPLELKWHILASLSDVRDLIAVTQTCRDMYTAFKANEATLPGAVLTNCVGRDVILEAILVDKCAPPFLISAPIKTTKYRPMSLCPHQLHQCQRYAEQFIQGQLCGGPSDFPPAAWWTMDEALRLSDFHTRVVEPLACEFVRSCAREPWSYPGMDLDDSLQSRPATRLERERIARALYRFELFRKLFGRWGDRQQIWHRLTDQFIELFAGWEIVQLGIIHDFLARQVIPAYADIAEHDIEWGAYAIDVVTPWDGCVAHGGIQHLLRLGLKTILDISRCDSFKSSIQMLGDGTMMPIENTSFLYQALQSNFSPYMPSPFPSMPVYPKLPAFLFESFQLDTDAGPIESWTWSLTQDRCALYDPRDWVERRWGFAMWDFARLQELGVLDQPWKCNKDHEQRIPHQDAEQSLRERCRLWQFGGRGYWTKGDESRVVWIKGRYEHKPVVETTTTTDSDISPTTEEQSISGSSSKMTLSKRWKLLWHRLRVLRTDPEDQEFGT